MEALLPKVGGGVSRDGGDDEDEVHLARAVKTSLRFCNRLPKPAALGWV